jgi:hypothetical protein
LNVSSDKQTLGEVSKNVLTFVLHPVCIGANYLGYKVIKFIRKVYMQRKRVPKSLLETTTVSAVPNHRFVV